MTRSHLARAVVAAALAGTVLAGCEIRGEYAAECTTSPPVPHHNFGAVAVDIETPLKVTPGQAFTIRVDHMSGYPYGGSGSSFPSGVLTLNGAVEPSGPFSVGPGFLGGTPYPQTLSFTATGEPGDVIEIVATSGSSFQGATFPEGVAITCYPDARIGTIEVVAPGA